jgi:hypothetical protein
MTHYKLEQWNCCQFSTKINNFDKPYCQIQQQGYLQFYLNVFPMLKCSFYSFTVHPDIVTSLNAQQVVHSVGKIKDVLKSRFMSCVMSAFPYTKCVVHELVLLPELKVNVFLNSNSLESLQY